MIKILIPTIKKYNEIAQQVEDIQKSISPGIPVLATCRNLSAAANRNLALSWCDDGDIVIMLDDDITGFHDGWMGAMIEPIRAGASIAAARLLNLHGEPGPMIGAEDRNGLEVYEAHGGAVPSAAISFIKDDLIFDENYAGAGYEDSDYCRQKKMKYPDGQIVITNKARLIHKLEFKHYGADTANAKYYANKWEHNISLDCLIFSRNRPAQLDLLLDSIREYMPSIHNTIHVLYSYTHDMYKHGYDRVMKRHHGISWKLQNNFMDDVRFIVSNFSKKYCLMLVDDGVFIRTPPMVDLLDNYTDDVCTVSLRLSPSAKHCTPAGKDMVQPSLQDMGTYYKWDYTKCERHMDWGYPHGLDGNIFRTEYLKSMMNHIECNNPNELEARMISRIPDKPNMLCGRETSWILISANRVANGNTPHMEQTVETLNETYTSGNELSNEWRGKEKLEAVNILSPYVILKPTVGIHFHYNGVMNGCYKVWANTVKGLEIAGLPYSKSIEKYNGAINKFDGMPKNTLVGPETMVLPRENYGMWQRFNNFAVPCRWVRDSYLKDLVTHKHNIYIWPVGVDTEKWNWSTGGLDEDGMWRCLVFKKTVNLSQDTVDRRYNEVLKVLGENNTKAITLTYGSYAEEELVAAVRKCDFAVWISGTESQNIALLEVLSSGIPVYVYDQLEQSYAGQLMEGLTSAPYFDSRCGMKETNADRLAEFIDKYTQYNPRDYIMDYFTLDKCAKDYYKMITECRE